MQKQIVCINWGKKYGAAYVNRLYAMVSRNLSQPFRFTCFTDSSQGFRREIDAQPLPELDVKMPTGTFGIWPKARLWSAKLADLTGPVLFFDLDLVIVNDLEPFFEYGNPEDVILARNPAVPLERLGQTSLFRFPVGKLKPLQDFFRADPQGVADSFRYEQRLVSRMTPDGIKFWPRGWVRNWKQHCQRPLPFNFFIEPKLPRKSRVVIFPGRISPHHAVKGVWGDGYQALPPWRYLRHALGGGLGGSRLRHLRHYFMPPQWLLQHWRE